MPLIKPCRLKLFAVIFILLVSFTSFGHEYFFGFSELEYNDVSRKFECTIIVSTHDVERALEKSNIETGDLANLSQGTDGFLAVSKYLNSHFVVTCEEQVKFKLIGSEVLMSGTTNFYFESEAIDLFSEITVSFDLLMDTFQQQQNKITFKYRNNSYTRTFLYNERVQSIIIEN